MQLTLPVESTKRQNADTVLKVQVVVRGDAISEKVQCPMPASLWLKLASLYAPNRKQCYYFFSPQRHATLSFRRGSRRKQQNLNNTVIVARES